MDKETPISFDHLLLLWEKAFLDLVPVALSASGWTSDGKPVTSGDARIALAAVWADAVITEHAKRFAPQSNAAGPEVDKEDESHHGHTPGPWTLKREGLDGEDYIITSQETGQHVLCGGISRDYEKSGPDWMRCMSDARLIAAAPELLEALALAERFMCGFEGDPMQAEIEGSLRQMRTAIAKATGATP